MGSNLMISREKECIMNRAVEGVLGWWPASGARRWHELLVICLWRKEGRMDGLRIGNLWVERGDSACLFALSDACVWRTDIDAHNVKSECNMKIVPFKGVLWLLGGARRQLHGKRPFEGTLVAGWCAAPGALVMHAKKGRTSTSTA
jgi:hypothetical protein